MKSVWFHLTADGSGRLPGRGDQEAESSRILFVYIFIYVKFLTKQPMALDYLQTLPQALYKYQEEPGTKQDGGLTGGGGGGQDALGLGLVTGERVGGR